MADAKRAAPNQRPLSPHLQIYRPPLTAITSILTRIKRAETGGPADVKPMRLFHGSISYLALLFLAIGIDPFVG